MKDTSQPEEFNAATSFAEELAQLLEQYEEDALSYIEILVVLDVARACLATKIKKENN